MVVDEEVAEGAGEGPAGILGQVVVLELAGVPVEDGRDGAAAGHEQLVALNDERALRGHATEGRRVVRLLHVL